MTGIVTRSHRLNCRRCKNLPSGISCRNVRYLISAKQMTKKPAKARTAGADNEKEERVISRKKQFRPEVNQLMLQKGKYSETYASVGKDNLREGPTVSIYKRITRSTGKFMLETESSNSIRGDAACKDVRNNMEGEKNDRQAKELHMNKGENSNEAIVEFGPKNQDRKTEIRMTRSKKNLLLQIQADKENVDGCVHDQKIDGSFLVDSDKSPILTYNHTLQRKRKRMSVKMYDEGLEDPFCISEKYLGSKHHTKKVIPFRAITRNAIHKQNACSVINANTTQRERESDADLENQCRDVENQELPEDTVNPQLEETGDMRLRFKDAQYGFGTVKNTESTFDKEEVNPVLASNSSLNVRKEVDCHTMASSRRAKVIVMGSIPKRVTRSMQNVVLNLDHVQINGKPVITHKKKNKNHHSIEVKNSLRTESQSHSRAVACREETQLRDESCPKDKRIMKLNYIEPMSISSEKSAVTEHDNSSSIDVLGKSKFFENFKEVDHFQGKDHVYRISRRKGKQKYDMPRKEYLTRSKHNKNNIQEYKDMHSLPLKTERSISPCNKNKLNSSIGEAGDADGSSLINKPAFLEQNESAKDNTVIPSSLCIESKEEESKSSVQATIVSEQTGKFPITSQSDVTCYEKICNGNTPKTLGCLSAVDEIQSGAPLFAGSIDHVGRKSGDLAVPNVELSETNARVVSSIGVDGNTCLESERQTCEALFISRRVNDLVGKFQKSKVYEHNSMQHNDFATKDKKKSVRFTNNPNDLARQIRPRPLDPLQLLPVFIEGCDQEFYDLDSISLPWHPTHSEEENLNSVAVDGEVASQSKQRTTILKSKKEEIKIPSYRTVSDYADVRGSLLGGKSIYSIPGSYIKHIEMPAKKSMIGLEYDIEDDDQQWLRNFNKGIAGKKPSFQLTEDKFEELIEYFEKKSAKISAVQVAKVPSKDWKDKSNMNTTLKTEKMPKSDSGKQLELPRENASAMLSSVSQTSECCICNGGENSVSNPVYRCKGCEIHVHQSCYGINDQKIAAHTERLQTFQWLCRKCDAFGNGNIDICCAICCKNGGALKPTTNPAKWAHVVCALYTDETFFLDTDSMEPIEGVPAVEARLRKQKRLCCFCDARVGSCERCSVYGCEVMFHISCGVSRGAYFELQHNNQQVVSVRSFCPQHANMAAKSPSNKKDKAEKRTYCSDLDNLAISSEADEINFSQQKLDDAGQLQCVLLQSDSAYNGVLGEGSNVKDACQVPVKDDASVLKRQKAHKLRHGFRSAVRLNRLKTENRNKLCLLDGGLDSQSSVISSSLQLLARSQQRHGPHLSDHMQYKGTNVGLIESCTSGRWNVNESDRYPCIKLKEVLKEKIGPAFVVREVYSYWLRKRAKKRGPLLQEIQQEEAARTHDIFNRDSAGIREYFGLKEDCPVDFKMVQKNLSELQRDLKSVRSIAELIIKREKVKAQLCSYFQGQIELNLLSLQEELGLMYCFLCKSSENLLHCAQCKRIFCFKCYKHWKVHGLKSYRIESCRKCICKDCEVLDKTDSVDVELEKFSMKSEEKIERSSQSTHALGQSLKVNLKLGDECGTEGLEVQNASFPNSTARHEVAENTDSRVNASNIPSMQEINNICNFPPCTAQIGSLGLIDVDPLDDKGRQRSSSRTVPLSQLSDVVSLNTASLVKLPPTDCHNNVQKTRYKRRKLETLDPIPISS